MRKVVINSTPLIALCHIDCLWILKELYHTVYIPNAVYNEISVKKDSVCKYEIEKSLEWIKVENIQNEMAKLFYQSKLHEGEVEVMILAKEMNADLIIIDDKNAKKHAKYLKLNVTGTLGVLIKAKKEKLIAEIKPLIIELRKKGIYLDDRLIEYCLKEAEEI